MPALALNFGTYDFDDATSPTTRVTAKGVDPSVTFSTFSTNGITPNATEFAAGNPNIGQGINYQNWSTAGINLSKYYNFTITPNSGMMVNLNTLTLDALRSGTGPSTIEVRSSIDTYATSLLFTLPTVGTTGTVSNLSFTSYTVALNLPLLQNVTNAVEFRIYGYSAGSTSGTLRLDNVKLDGSTMPVVAVPFGFTPVWGIAVNGVVFGLRKLRNKRMKSTGNSIVEA